MRTCHTMRSTDRSHSVEKPRSECWVIPNFWGVVWLYHYWAAFLSALSVASTVHGGKSVSRLEEQTLRSESGEDKWLKLTRTQEPSLLR
jgi:hypothetical protein